MYLLQYIGKLLSSGCSDQPEGLFSVSIFICLLTWVFGETNLIKPGPCPQLALAHALSNNSLVTKYS